MDTARLSWVCGGVEGWETGERTRCRIQEAKGTKGKGRVSEFSGLYREQPLEEGQPSPRAREFRIEDRVRPPDPVTTRDCRRLAAGQLPDVK